jgi:hypothetical protein
VKDMLIRKIVVDNFMSFHGQHVITFEKGSNFIIGPCGTGITNLARAVKFAILGHSDIPRKHLINYFHRKKCLAKSENSYCHVSIEIERENISYLAQSHLSLIQNMKIRQSTIVPVQIEKLLTHKTFEHVYLTPTNIGYAEDQESSIATRVTQYLIKNLNLNVKAGIRMAILDRMLSHYTYTQREQMFDLIEEIDMDQFILLESAVLPSLENRATAIRLLTFDKETISSKLAS